MKIGITGPSDLPEETRDQGEVFERLRAEGHDPVLIGCVRKEVAFHCDALYLSKNWSNHPRSISLAYWYLSEGKTVSADFGEIDDALSLNIFLA